MTKRLVERLACVPVRRGLEAGTMLRASAELRWRANRKETAERRKRQAEAAAQAQRQEQLQALAPPWTGTAPVRRGAAERASASRRYWQLGVSIQRPSYRYSHLQLPIFPNIAIHSCRELTIK